MDPRALVGYLTLQYVPPPRSGFEGIRKLCPGERLIVEAGQVRVERYWDLSFEKADVGSEEDALDSLDSLLAQATRDRLAADVPLGAFLSGGIDSSLVVGYMADASSQVKTFSISFPEADFDESEHARRVAEIYGTVHEDRLLEPAILPLVADTVRYAGEPFADSSAIPTLLLSRMTKERVTVALSGDGGDEAFAGYPRYLSAREFETRPARRAAARALEATGALRLLSPERRRAARALAMTAAGHYASLMSHFTPAELSRLCTADFIEQAGGTSAAWEQTLAAPDLDGVDRYLCLDTATYLPGDLLLKVDRMSMSTALEVRSPLLDHRVHELAASLPGDMKLRGRTTKWALKEIARRRGLPADLIERPKQGFGVPVGKWMRGELRPWLEDLLLDPVTLARGQFDPDGVRRLLGEHLDRRADHTHRLWNLTALELWQRHWIDGD